MNAKELTTKTIIENGFVIGNKIKGKGLEIIEGETRVFYSYGELSSDELEKFKKLVEQYDENKMYFSSYYIDGVWSKTQTFKTQAIPFKKLYKMILKNPSRFTSIQVAKVGEKLGHISLSKYKSDRDSQIELCQDLIALEGLSIRGDYYDCSSDGEYDDEIFHFKSQGDHYWNGDYLLEHGSSVCECPSDSIYFKGRMINYNESELEFFVFDEGEYLKEIDPEETISVYQRDGKYWYIAYALEEKEMLIYSKREDYEYDKEESEEESVFFVTYKENKELLEKAEEFLKDTKEDLEMRSFICNELDIKYSYRECNVDFKAVELCFEDVDGMKEEIWEKISLDYETIKSDFSRAYNDALNERLTVDDDYTVTVEKYFQYGENRIAAYTHLSKLKRLEKKFNFELVKSAISENDSMVSWAIKRGDEEYHFNLASLIAHDVLGDHSVRDFLTNALAMLEKRKFEKIKESELYEKAAKVFVGVQDSLSSGNCQLGTNQFVHKYNIDTTKVGGIRGDVLLGMEKSNFTLRAVAYAVASHNVA